MAGGEVLRVGAEVVVAGLSRRYVAGRSNPLAGAMPRRTLTAQTLKIRPEKRQVDVLPDIRGRTLPVHVHALVSSHDPNTLRDDDKQVYARIIDSVPAGCGVLVHLESGYYGDTGNTINTTDHTVAHTRTTRQASTVASRAMVIAPPGGGTALVYLEQVAGSAGGGRAFVRLLRDSIFAAIPDSYVPVDTIVESKAWLAEAELNEVRAVRTVAYAVPHDIADEITPDVVGTVRHVLQPPKGQQHFPRKIWEMIRDRKIRAAQYMGFEESDDDPYETIVELEHKGRKKSFALGRERTPSVQILLSEPGESAISDDAFMERCFSEAREFYSGVGLSWEDRWRYEPWG
ncbi:hypothetical protein, partial [Isoptericola sp. NPDC056134]|uniref:hypothetical protein n=1 Tax=Isoptericola sp. NPDC056134 TaxID=3345723 RepID=UPI0035EA8871